MGQGIPVLSPWINRMMLYLRNMYLPGQYEINPDLVANVHRNYVALIAEGLPKATPKKIIPGEKYPLVTWIPETYKMARLINERTKIDKMIIYMIFTALFDMARKGKIPMKKWDPKGVQQTTQLQQTIDKPWWLQAGQFATGTAKMIPLLLIGGSVIGLLYLTKGVKSGNN